MKKISLWLLMGITMSLHACESSDVTDADDFTSKKFSMRTRVSLPFIFSSSDVEQATQSNNLELKNLSQKIDGVRAVVISNDAAFSFLRGEVMFIAHEAEAIKQDVKKLKGDIEKFREDTRHSFGRILAVLRDMQGAAVKKT